ncbi:MAG: hypothetical protein ACSLFR_14955 [Solirubrobacteraceae bacterium]
MAPRVPLAARPSLTIALLALLALALVCAVAVTPADAATRKKKKATPVFPTISKVSPDRARVGETLTIRGKNYLVGKGRTTVVFKRDGKKALFVKATLSTKTMLKVVVPKALATQLATQDGYPLFTRFRLRIGAKRFGKKYTANKLSIGPETQADVDVDACAKVRTGTDPNGDLDGDLLTNAEELNLTNPLNPCTADTDGDGMGDGWEYYSAKDLNQRAVPYPGKRPFPNGLQADNTLDFDGDGLRAEQEHRLWNSFGRPFQTMADRDQLLYSDGTQASSGPGPNQLADLPTLQANAAACGYTVVPPNFGYLGQGYVDATRPVEDDEKDADHDGLGNWAESNGWMQTGWWTKIFPNEPQYPLRNFADLDPVDSDVDGDGCLDGLDDQDADDFMNWMEHGEHYGTWQDNSTQWLGFALAGFPSWNGWADAGNDGAVPYAVNPFNPCLPDMDSRTCSKYVSNWAPFTDPYKVAGCLVTITYRGDATPVWVWDAQERIPWDGACPP